MRNKNLHILTQCALMVALSAVLALVSFRVVPQGGMVTAASAVPIILISHFYGLKWGIPAGLVFGGIHLLIDFYPPPAQIFWAFAGVILLDYLVAFGVFGLVRIFLKPFKSRTAGAAVAAAACCLLRYLCHFTSGILIWGSYAWEGWPVWLYSLAYNATYMLPEIVITAAVTVLILKFLDKPLEKIIVK